MTGSAYRRVAIVLALYVIGAWLVADAAEWFRRVLALPEMFESLLRVSLWLGAPLAGFLAWRYPTLGDSSGQPPAGFGPESHGPDGPAPPE